MTEEATNTTHNIRANPWIISTLVLGILAMILLFNGGSLTGNVVSEKEASQIIVDFVKSQLGQELEVIEVNEQSGLYEVILNYQGQEVPLYITKDGKNLVQGLTSLETITEERSSAQEEIVKSDKPKVELFIMTYCPYGTQAEKGFIPVIRALSDSIDAKIMFVHYFMHGDKEEQETNTQVCIREEQPAKFLDYLECFLNDGDSAKCLIETGIDKDKLNNCIANGNAEKYYKTDSQSSEDYGVQGSPTLVINGEMASSERSSDAFLQTICSAFNKAPGECSSLQLSSEIPSPGFGYSTSGSATTASCG